MQSSIKIDKKEIIRRKQQSQKDKQRQTLGGLRVGSIGNREKTLTVSKAPAISSTTVKPFFNVGVSKNNGSVLVRGCDYLLQYSSAANVVPYTNMFSVAINPLSQNFSSTRLSNFALNYEKYVFKKIVFHLTAMNSTNSTGGYVMAYDRDVSDAPPAPSNQGIQTMYANTSSTFGSAWESRSLVCTLDDTQDFYYTNYDGTTPRLTYQGILNVLSATTIVGPIQFMLWMEYEIMLMNPALENQDVSSQVNPIVASLPSGGPLKLVSLINQGSTVAGSPIPVNSNQNQILQLNNSSKLQNNLSSINLPSGYFSVEIPANVQNLAASTVSPQIFSALQSNLQIPNNLPQIVLSNLTKGIINYVTSGPAGTLSNYAVGLYTQFTQGSSATVMDFVKLYIYSPQGGSFLQLLFTELNTEASGNLIAYIGGLISIQKISQQQFLAAA